MTATPELLEVLKESTRRRQALLERPVGESDVDFLDRVDAVLAWDREHLKPLLMAMPNARPEK